MDKIEFPFISGALLGTLLDMGGKAGIMSPRPLMDQIQSLKKHQLAELYEGGFIQLLEENTIAFTPIFDKVVKVLLNPRTNVTFRFWGIESSWAESSLLFPGDILEGDGVVLNQLGRFYRISGFYDDQDLYGVLSPLLPRGLNNEIDFEAHLQVSTAAVLFALLDLYRLSVSSGKKEALESGFTEVEINGYVQGQWGLTQFDRLITYITVSGMKPLPPASFEVQRNLQILTDAGVIQKNKQHYYLLDHTRSIVEFTPGLISGLHWQRATLHYSGELLCCNRLFLFGDRSFTLSVTPTTRGKVYISTIKRDDIIDFLIEENTSPHTISSGEIGLEKLAVKRTVDTPETRICPECEQTIDSDASFCSNCGAAIAEQKQDQSDSICPSCKEPVDSDSVYCSQCGQSLH